VGRGGERRLSAVGVAEEEHRCTDRLQHRYDISALILKAVPFGRVRFPPAAAGDGIDSELLLEERLYELPVGVVVAEGAVHEDQGRAAAVLIVGDCDASG